MEALYNDLKRLGLNKSEEAAAEAGALKAKISKGLGEIFNANSLHDIAENIKHDNRGVLAEIQEILYKQLSEQLGDHATDSNKSNLRNGCDVQSWLLQLLKFYSEVRTELREVDENGDAQGESFERNLAAFKERVTELLGVSCTHQNSLPLMEIFPIDDLECLPGTLADMQRHIDALESPLAAAFNQDAVKYASTLVHLGRIEEIVDRHVPTALKFMLGTISKEQAIAEDSNYMYAVDQLTPTAVFNFWNDFQHGYIKNKLEQWREVAQKVAGLQRDMKAYFDNDFMLQYEEGSQEYKTYKKLEGEQQQALQERDELLKEINRHLPKDAQVETLFEPVGLGLKGGGSALTNEDILNNVKFIHSYQELQELSDAEIEALPAQEKAIAYNILIHAGNSLTGINPALQAKLSTDGCIHPSLQDAETGARALFNLFMKGEMTPLSLDTLKIAKSDTDGGENNIALLKRELVSSFLLGQTPEGSYLGFDWKKIKLEEVDKICTSMGLKLLEMPNAKREIAIKRLKAELLRGSPVSASKEAIIFEHTLLFLMAKMAVFSDARKALELFEIYKGYFTAEGLAFFYSVLPSYAACKSRDDEDLLELSEKFIDQALELCSARAEDEYEREMGEAGYVNKNVACYKNLAYQIVRKGYPGLITKLYSGDLALNTSMHPINDIVNDREFAISFTLLTAAVVRGNVEQVEELLSCGAKVDKGDGSRTPLMFAAMQDDLEMVELLVKKGANINAETAEGRTPLSFAISANSTRSVKFLLENDVEVPHYVKPSGWPLLLYAIEKECDIEIIGALLEAGAGDDEKVNETFLLEGGGRMHNVTPLLYAAQQGKMGVARLLLDKGADPDVGVEKKTIFMDTLNEHLNSTDAMDDATEEVDTPLTLAARNNDLNMVELLLEGGANPNVYVSSAQTAFYVAMEEEAYEIAFVLVNQKGFDVKQRSNAERIFEENILHAVAKSGVVEIMEVLTKREDIYELLNQKNIYDKTPLQIAFENENSEMVRVLLQAGADPTLVELSSLNEQLEDAKAAWAEQQQAVGAVEQCISVLEGVVEQLNINAEHLKQKATKFVSFFVYDKDEEAETEMDQASITEFDATINNEGEPKVNDSVTVANDVESEELEEVDRGEAMMKMILGDGVEVDMEDNEIKAAVDAMAAAVSGRIQEANHIVKDSIVNYASDDSSLSL